MKLPSSMSGWQLTRHGGPRALFWNEHIPVRLPESNEVLVQVMAAGVNNTDINTRIGWYSCKVLNSTETVDTNVNIEAGGWSGALKFPLIQGSDLCGKVVAVGEEVSNFEAGMRVTCPTNQPIPTDAEPSKFIALGSEFDGAFAQYCTLPANQLWDVSSSPLSDAEIAVLPCAFGTALNLLSRASVSEKDIVLISGASGGVGLAAVQLAKLKGAKVIGIASDSKQAAVSYAGADAVISRDDRLAPKSVNVVIDVVGGPHWQHLIAALKPAGRYAVSGAIAGPLIEADLREIYLNDLTLFGCTYQSKPMFDELVSLINAGQIKPHIAKTYPLKELLQAQIDFEKKRYPGKLVLLVNKASDNLS